MGKPYTSSRLEARRLNIKNSQTFAIVHEPIVEHYRLNTTFTGVHHNISTAEQEIWQFRGIKYANIPGRFRQSTLNSIFPSVGVDATRYGPKCPQPSLPTRLEDPLIGVTSAKAQHAPDTFSEFECLNLNITTPAGQRFGSDLPVMVYIHGGGGYSGANSDWWCDGGSLVKRSLDEGKGVIHVALNYRLSVFGFLGSEELKQQNGKLNGGNFGLRDIHMALKWLHHNIPAFGGSATNITLYGSSAGSLAVQSLIHSTLPAYFRNAILQSQVLGAPLFSAPQTLESATQVCESVKRELQVETVKELEDIDTEKLVKAYQSANPRNGLAEIGTIDGEFWAETWKDRLSLPGNVMLGTNANESAVIKLISSSSPKPSSRPSTKSILASLSSVKTEHGDINNLLSTYRISKSSQEPDLSTHLLEMVEDSMWYSPTHALAQKLRKAGVRTHEYSFAQGKPFGGEFEGKAVHALELAYLHGNPAFFKPTANSDEERAVQKEMQSAWLAFAQSTTPPAWSEDEVRIFGNRTKEAESVSVEGSGEWSSWINDSESRGAGDSKSNGVLSGSEYWSSEKRQGRWAVWSSFKDEEVASLISVTLTALNGLLGQGP
ncbi:Carboxylesterase family-domain-containing protein [Tricladium varicosporioides]|nr:Carboxylesterase family-domain-containing protein [Hymenoscyphus varicosporioides]